VALSAASSGQLTTVTSNNATINYTLTQGSVQRSGVIHLSRFASGSTVAYDEDYNQTAATDIVFSANANTTQANLYYTTTTATNMLYQVNTVR
jgi:N-acyl-L-homoserine lactone synthetase